MIPLDPAALDATPANLRHWDGSAWWILESQDQPQPVPPSPLDAAAAIWAQLPDSERAALAVLRSALLLLLREGDYSAARAAVAAWPAPAGIDAARADELRAGLLSIIPEAAP